MEVSHECFILIAARLLTTFRDELSWFRLKTFSCSCGRVRISLLTMWHVKTFLSKKILQQNFSQMANPKEQVSSASFIELLPAVFAFELRLTFSWKLWQIFEYLNVIMLSFGDSQTAHVATGWKEGKFCRHGKQHAFNHTINSIVNKVCAVSFRANVI